MLRKVILALLVGSACSIAVRADLTLTVIEYRVLTDLAQIRLTSTSVHDDALQERMVNDRERFEQNGIVLVQGESERVFTRTERIDAHVVETKVTIQPASGRGVRGGLPTAQLAVAVDGKKRIDCPYDAGDAELHDVAILVRDGAIRLRGSFKHQAFDQIVPLVDGKLVDVSWLMALPR